MIITLEEARKVLRFSSETHDGEIAALVGAVPLYLEETTGYKFEGEASPLAKTVAGLLVKLWFRPSGDMERLQRTIDSLLAALTLTVDRSGSSV